MKNIKKWNEFINESYSLIPSIQTIGISEIAKFMRYGLQNETANNYLIFTNHPEKFIDTIENELGIAMTNRMYFNEVSDADELNDILKPDTKNQIFITTEKDVVDKSVLLDRLNSFIVEV